MTRLALILFVSLTLSRTTLASDGPFCKVWNVVKAVLSKARRTQAPKNEEAPQTKPKTSADDVRLEVQRISENTIERLNASRKKLEAEQLSPHQIGNGIEKYTTHLLGGGTYRRGQNAAFDAKYPDVGSFLRTLTPAEFRMYLRNGGRYKPSWAPKDFPPEKYQEWTQSLSPREYGNLIINGARYYFPDAPPNFEVRKFFNEMTADEYTTYIMNGGRYLGRDYAPKGFNTAEIVARLKKLPPEKYEEFLVDNGVFAEHWIQEGAVPEGRSLARIIEEMSPDRFRQYVVNGGPLNFKVEGKPVKVERQPPKLSAEEYGNYLLRVQHLDGPVEMPKDFDLRKWVNSLSSKDYGWLLKGPDLKPGEAFVVLTYLGDQYISRAPTDGNTARMALGDRLVTFTMMNTRTRNPGEVKPGSPAFEAIKKMMQGSVREQGTGTDGNPTFELKFKDRAPTDQEVKEFADMLDEYNDKLRSTLLGQPGLTRLASERVFIRGERAYLTPEEKARLTSDKPEEREAARTELIREGLKTKPDAWQPDRLPLDGSYDNKGALSLGMDLHEITGFIHREGQTNDYIPVIEQVKLAEGSKGYYMGNLKGLYPGVNGDMKSRIGQFSSSEFLHYMEPGSPTKIVRKGRRHVAPGDTYTYNGQTLTVDAKRFPYGIIVIDLVEVPR